MEQQEERDPKILTPKP